jgi:hypothetical protein
MLSRIVNKITNIVKHPQFQKMSNYYTSGLPFAVMLGGMSGTMIGVSMLDKYIEDRNSPNKLIQINITPRKGIGIIIGGFCAGLVCGILYPVALPFSAIYLINQTLNQLKED